LSAEIGAMEIRGGDAASGLRSKLSGVRQRREADARRRGVAFDAVVAMEGELQAARQDIDRERRPQAGHAAIGDRNGRIKSVVLLMTASTSAIRIAPPTARLGQAPPALHVRVGPRPSFR
jgi:hypothetical protein